MNTTDRGTRLGHAIRYIVLSLTVLLVLLKVVGVVAWSWWLVFTPLLVMLGLALLAVTWVCLLALTVKQR